MPCWVIPARAVEMAGSSLLDLLRGIQTGAIAAKIDAGMVVVDAMPRSRAEVPRCNPAHSERMQLSDAEMAALSATSAMAGHGDHEIDEDERGPAGDPDPEIDHIEADPGPPLHWERVRARVARQRKPPGAQ